MSTVLPLTIREWRPRDLPDIDRIEIASFVEPWPPETFRSEMSSERARGLVACHTTQEGESVVGFSLCWVVADELHLLVLAVDPAYRRLGVARALMDELEWQALGEDLAWIDLEVRPSNDAARDLYETLGFSVVGVRPRYYNNREDALLMRKLLGDEDVGEDRE